VEQPCSELHVGDRIIEVNGEPVQHESLAEVWRRTPLCLWTHALLLKLIPNLPFF